MQNSLALVFKSKLARIALVLFVILTAWWLWLQFFDQNLTDDKRQLWAASYQVIALFGGITGIFISKTWGGWRSVFGRAILAFSIGLFLQSFGQSAYSFYIYYLKIDIPYPSMGDIGFFGSVLFYIYGVTQLAHVAGVKVSLKSFGGQILALLLPLLMLVLSYFVFLRGHEYDWSVPLTVLLDFGYPFGQAIYVSIALLTLYLSRKILGGIMKGPIILLLIALVVQYISDYTFLYQASRELWVVGGSNDFMYSVSYFLMSISLIYVGTILSKIRES